MFSCAGYKVIWISNFESIFFGWIIPVIRTETYNQRVPMNCISLFEGHTSGTTLQYLVATSFVNRYFDLEICLKLSTILASFPGIGFNFL